MSASAETVTVNGVVISPEILDTRCGRRRLRIMLSTVSHITYHGAGGVMRLVNIFRHNICLLTQTRGLRM